MAAPLPTFMATPINGLKINLLPGYVKKKEILKRTIIGCVVATGLVASGLLVVLEQRRLDLQTVNTNLAAAQTVASQATTVEAEKNASLGTAAPITTAVSFMASASKTGPQRAALLNLVRQYIYEDAIVSSIDISDGQNIKILATVRTPDEYARFLLNLRRAADVNGGTLFKGLPIASGPGGFANGAVPFLRNGGDGSGQPVPQIYPVNVTAQGVLLNPVQIPPDPVGDAPAGGAGAAGALGAPALATRG